MSPAPVLMPLAPSLLPMVVVSSLDESLGMVPVRSAHSSPDQSMKDFQARSKGSSKLMVDHSSQRSSQLMFHHHRPEAKNSLVRKVCQSV